MVPGHPSRFGGVEIPSPQQPPAAADLSSTASGRRHLQRHRPSVPPESWLSDVAASSSTPLLLPSPSRPPGDRPRPRRPHALRPRPPRCLLGAYTGSPPTPSPGPRGWPTGLEIEAASLGRRRLTPRNAAWRQAIASGAENVAKGILWCGGMTVDRLRWGNEVLRKRIQPGDTEAEVSPEMLRRIKR
ncbi:hypothetical protein ZWY2020_029332 [Hordeum vulgare]|nr:hypothetical protein ZWY2020_029332 [Hordeum vulgare]